jgi:WD40 repeat protein
MGHELNVTSLDFSIDGSILVSASKDCTVRVWDTKQQNRKHTLRGHSDWVRCAVVSPDGNLVASASDDRSVRLWDISKDRGNGNQEERLFSGEDAHSDYVFAVTFSPKGNYLASGGDDLKVMIWKLDLDGDQEKPWTTMASTSERRIRGLAFTEDEMRVLSCDVGGVVRIWNLKTSLCEQVLSPESSSQLFTSIQFREGHLLTEIGAWPIPIEASTPSGSVFESGEVPDPKRAVLVRSKLPKWCRYGISEDRDWITWNNKNLIFLPTQYRPDSSDLLACRVQGRMVVIGCDSGQVLFFKFSREGLPSEVQRTGEDEKRRALGAA